MANESREIRGFTVHYTDGTSESLDHLEETACLLLVEKPSGIEVRGHGSDEGMARTLDAFFGKHKDLLTTIVKIRAKVFPMRLPDEGATH